MLRRLPPQTMLKGAVTCLVVCCSVVATASPYTDLLDNLNPLSNWRLGESSGTTATDAETVSNGTYRNGVLLGQTGAISGDTNTSVDFDGADDHIEIPHHSSYLLDDGTVILWFRADDTTGRQDLFSKDANGFVNGGHLTIYLNGSTLIARQQSSSTSYSIQTTGVTASTWHMVAYTWGAGGMRLYMNGLPVASDAYTGGLGTTSGGSGNTEPIAIGANTWQSNTGQITPLQDYFDGRIDEVSMFDTALSPGDISNLYQAGRGNVFYVRTDGNDSNSGNGSSTTQAWASVSAAVQKSLPAGALVYIQAGTYAGTVTPSVDGKAIEPIKFIADIDGVVTGWTPGPVTLQASSGGYAIDITSDNYLEFHGFTIIGDPALDAVDIDSTGIVIARCDISGGNKGIEVGSGSATIINCLVHNNNNDGIRIENGTVTIWNTTVVDNPGDGIRHDAGTSTITNCIIFNNSGDGLDSNGGTLTHSYNLVYGNGDDYDGTSAGTGEISVDPDFRSISSYYPNDTSPVIDAGDDAYGIVDVDLEGTARPLNSGWDMGAYEWQPPLIGHWKFDEGTGNKAADSSFNNNDAGLSGASWTTDCVGQNALATDGFGGIAQTGDPFDPPAAGSVAFWMRGSGPVGSRERVFGVNGNWEARLETTGLLKFDLGGSPLVGNEPFTTVTTVDEANRWYHIVASYDTADDSFEVYVDGVLETSGTSAVALDDQAAGTLSFGTRTGSTEYWEGALRDFRVYNRRLQADEVAEIYGLVAHWKLDETAGTTASDSSGSGNDGTFSGSPTWTTAGRIDGALDFEASDGADRIDVPSFDLTGSGVTISAWINLENGYSDSRIVLKSDGNNGADQLWGMTVASATRVDFRIRVGGTFNQLDTANGVVAPGTWHHVAGTYDGTTMRVYIDGAEVTSAAHTVGGDVDVDPAVGITMGDSPVGSRTFDGILDDVRVYNRPLCASEIQRIFDAGSPDGVRIISWVETQ